MLLPVGDHDARLGQAGELLDVEQLVTDAGVEGLDEWVLPRRARLDERGAGLGEHAPVLERVRGHLRAVVHPQELRGAALGDQPLQRRDDHVRVDAARDQHHQRLARELVNDVQQLQRPRVGRLIELEIERPHVIRPLGAKPLGRDRRLPEPSTLALALRDPEPLLPPQALHPLAVHLPAQLPQPMMRTTVPPPRPLHREPAQLGAQRRVIIGPLRLVTLRRARLPDHPARPALTDAETVAKHRDRLAPAGRAYQFPRAISFNAWFSSTCSATIRLSCWFSRSSSFNRFASLAFIPPYWLRQRGYVCSLIPSSFAASGIVLPSPSSRSASRSLRITCSGVCLRRFIRVPSSPMIVGARNSHTGRTELRGSGQIRCDLVVSNSGLRFSSQFSTGSVNRIPPNTISRIPARIAMLPICAHPQALSSRPFSVSPVNRVVRCEARVALFMPPAIHSALTWE